MREQSSDTDPHDFGSSAATESILIVPPPPDCGVRAPMPPSIAGYQLQRKLGRGGMAEVFEALDLRLGRHVALKLLATARTDDPQWLARFRTEAAAFARLQHPHVVQIHEVGESAGRPFLALELVTGGSLADRLRSGPLDPREAAAVVRDLARAAHAVHEAGVVHRDLKPANVLIAERSGDSTVIPSAKSGDHLFCKIADFGLAHLLGGEVGLTETGAMLGTPSYMASEQAMESPTIGPAADIYALGAILYECLTGRPPFRAATTLETLELVRTAEPVPVRRLQPGVPRDLETIALTCLRKEPDERYRSAADLAADVDRFLHSEPIAARPAGTLERALKWCRRRPAVAALMAVSMLAAGVGVAGLLAHDASLQAALARTAAEKERADSNYREAREAFRQMLGRFEDRRYSEIPRAAELRNAQYEDALKFFAVIVDRQNDPDPVVRLDVAKTRLEVAKLQHALGRTVEAEQNARGALGLFGLLAAADPDRAELAAGQAECLAQLGVWLTRGPRDSEAAGLLVEAAAIYDRLLLSDPTNLTYRERRAMVVGAQGIMHFGRGNREVARSSFLREEEQRAGLVTDAPGDRRNLAALARVQTSLSLIAQLTDRAAENSAYYSSASANFERLILDDPYDAAAATGLAMLRVNWAYVLNANKKVDEALVNLDKSLAMLEPRNRAEPQLASYRNALMATHGVRAVILEGTGRFLEAAQSYERSLEFCEPGSRLGGRCELASLWAQAGEHAKAAELTTAILSGTEPLKSAWFTHLARALARSIATVERDAVLAERYAQLGASVLSRARRELRDEWPKFWQQVQSDSELQPLVDRVEVKAVIRE